VDSWQNATISGDPSSLPLVPSGSGGRTRTYYAPEVGGAAKVVHYDSADRAAVEEVLVEYRYIPKLRLSLDLNTLRGTSPLLVSFNVSVSGGLPPYSFLWDFGDGNVSNERNISHRYPFPGVYNATLAVTDASGQRVEERIPVQVDPPARWLALPWNSPSFLASLAGITAAFLLGAVLLLRRRRGRKLRAPTPIASGEQQVALPPPTDVEEVPSSEPTGQGSTDGRLS
jgi:hypothetical protein